ncbi:MAG: hypothetical protein ACRDBX_07520 [Erysipelotrichaceae bacterium]
MIVIKHVIHDACVSCYQIHDTLRLVKERFATIAVEEVVFDERLAGSREWESVPLLLIMEDDQLKEVIYHNLPYEILEIYLEELLEKQPATTL